MPTDRSNPLFPRAALAVLACAALASSCMQTAPRSGGLRADGGIPAAAAPDPRAQLAGEVSALREENNMLRARVQDVEQQMQNVLQESGRVRQDALRESQQIHQASGERATTVDRRIQELEKRLADQDRRLGEMDAARKKDMQQMQDRILTELAALLKEQERRSAPPRSNASGPAAAGEHVVAQGESLSVIARLHGTTTQKLMETNGITNPDQVRVGQRLRIP